MMTKQKESYDQERQRDDRRKNIVQEVMLKSTDFLWRIIAPGEGQGGGHTVARVSSMPPIPA